MCGFQKSFDARFSLRQIAILFSLMEWKKCRQKNFSFFNREHRELEQYQAVLTGGIDPYIHYKVDFR